MKRVRQVHMWLGLFFAPSILFFATSGALMTVGLHKGRPETAGEPPAWIVTAAEIHRKQRVAQSAPSAPKQAIEKATVDKPQRDATSSSAFRVFVVALAAGIGLVTLLGVWMSFKASRESWRVWTMLALGAAVPAALLLL